MSKMMVSTGVEPATLAYQVYHEEDISTTL